MATLATPDETDDQPHNEEKEVISTLPTDFGWRVDGLSLWRGFWFPCSMIHGAIAARNHFQLRPDDAFLASLPKSGTTWLKSLIFSTLNRNNHHPFSPQHPVLTTNPHGLVPFLDIDVYSSTNPNPDLTNIPSPRLFATHVSYQSLPESVKHYGCKIVYVCRNPKDNFVSVWHFMRKFRHVCEGPPVSLEEAFELFCRGISPFGPVWEHVLGYWKESLERPRKVLFFKYEELVDDPEFHLRKLAGFLGFPFSAEEEEKGTVHEIVKLCSFGNLCNLEVNKSGKNNTGLEYSSYFRRGVVGDWDNYLTPEMAERVDQITQQKWHGSGLTFPGLAL